MAEATSTPAVKAVGPWGIRQTFFPMPANTPHQMSRTQQSRRSGRTRRSEEAITGDRYWLAVAAYAATVTVAILGLLVAVGTVGRSPGIGFLSLVGLLGGSAFAITAALSMLRDVAYVDEQSSWTPNWWHFIGAPCGLAGGIALFGGMVADPAVGFLGGTLTLTIGMYVSAIVYLYRRHVELDVP